MIFLLTYKGRKKWNYDEARVVRASSVEAALAQAVAGDYECEEVPLDGPDEVILYHWVGDPG